MTAIQQVAQIQIEALASIIKNPNSVDRFNLCKLLQIQDDEIVSAANRLLDIFTNILHNNPECIKLLNDYQLMVCSHILFQIEDEIILDDPGSVAEAWSLIMEAQRKFHPELKLVISNI